MATSLCVFCSRSLLIYMLATKNILRIPKQIFNLSIQAMSALSQIPNADIDPDGVFKYILIKVSVGDSNKLIVRGYASCEYHANILHRTEKKEGAKGGPFKFKCLGGGRIRHESINKTLFVYGYSQGFGRADHTKTVEILQQHYPDYAVTWSNEGY